jgi:branched-chain amino acid transport system substrate-binding protein
MFELDSQDDAADPKTAVTVAQKLVDDRVAGVIGHTNSGTSIPASRIYAGAGIPMITESATNPLLTQQGFKSVFRMVANDVRQGSVIGTYLVRDLKATKVAIVDDRTAYGEGLADQVEKAVKSAGDDLSRRCSHLATSGASSAARYRAKVQLIDESWRTIVPLRGLISAVTGRDVTSSSYVG